MPKLTVCVKSYPPKVKKMNDLMTLVKASYAESKKTLKGYYPQERWPDYGIPDKR